MNIIMNLHVSSDVPTTLRLQSYRSVLVNTKLEDTTFVATETPTPRCQ